MKHFIDVGGPVLNGPASCKPTLVATRAYGAPLKQLSGQRCSTNSTCASSTCNVRCCDETSSKVEAAARTKHVMDEILAMEYHFADKCVRNEWPHAFEITGLPTHVKYEGKTYELNDVYTARIGHWSTGRPVGFRMGKDPKHNGQMQYYAQKADLYLRWSITENAWTLGPNAVSKGIAQLHLSTNSSSWGRAAVQPHDVWSIAVRRLQRGETPGAAWRVASGSGSWKTEWRIPNGDVQTTETDVRVLGIKYRKSVGTPFGMYPDACR